MSNIHFNSEFNNAQGCLQNENFERWCIKTHFEERSLFALFQSPFFSHQNYNLPSCVVWSLLFVKILNANLQILHFYFQLFFMLNFEMLQFYLQFFFNVKVWNFTIFSYSFFRCKSLKFYNLTCNFCSDIKLSNFTILLTTLFII